MYLKVLSDPWRRGLRERTGTSVQAVHEKKKKLNFTTKFKYAYFISFVAYLSQKK